MNQTQKVSEYMDKHGSITSMDAFIDLGITRLAARIADLEHQGVKISRETIYSKNRFGEKVHFTSYKKEVA